MSDLNKAFVSSASKILKELGYEVKTSHLYVLFARLSGSRNLHEASVKKISFAASLANKIFTLPVEVPERSRDITPIGDSNEVAFSFSNSYFKNGYIENWPAADLEVIASQHLRNKYSDAELRLAAMKTSGTASLDGESVKLKPMMTCHYFKCLKSQVLLGLFGPHAKPEDFDFSGFFAMLLEDWRWGGISGDIFKSHMGCISPEIDKDKLANLKLEDLGNYYLPIVAGRRKLEFYYPGENHSFNSVFLGIQVALKRGLLIGEAFEFCVDQKQIDVIEKAQMGDNFVHRVEKLTEIGFEIEYQKNPIPQLLIKWQPPTTTLSANSIENFFSKTWDGNASKILVKDSDEK